MIPLIPYWKFILDSPLSPEEAVSRLSAEVTLQQSESFWYETRSQAFTGAISKSEFCIARIIRYRNSFLPTLYGKFLPRETGVRIRVVMTLHPIILMIAVGLSLNAIPILLSILHQLITTGSISDRLKTGAEIIAALYLFFTAGFAFEAVIARRLLNRIFEAS